MTEIKICGIKYDEDIGIINELKPDYAGMVPVSYTHLRAHET